MARDFTQEIEDEEARRRLVGTPGLDRPAAPGRAVFVDAPGERQRLADLARADRERSRMMSGTRAERWNIDMEGGSTTRRNARKAAVRQDWYNRRDGLDARSMEAQRIKGRIDLQGRTNEGLVDVAKARADADRAAAAAALKGERYRADRTLEGEKYKSDNLLAGERERADAARDVADTNADAARDVQASKNEGERDVQAAKNAGALAVQQLQATQAGAEAVAAARAAAAQSGKPQGIKLDDNRSLVVLADGSSYVTTVDRKGNATTSYVPAADPAAQPAAGSVPAPAQPARRRYVPGGAK